MRRRPIRRAQLIAPFGPGAMMVAPDGTSLIAAGLDHWFSRPLDDDHYVMDPSEFQFGEWRLERELGVDYLCEPPDYRERPRQPWQPIPPNTGLKLPYLRFPQWHVCPVCALLQHFPLTLKDTPRCPACETKIGDKARKPPRMVQVRFIAFCDEGHIQDFPWREWVHQSLTPICSRPMKLRAGASTALSAVRVTCECSASRSLEGITEADPPTASTPNTEDNESGPPARPSTHLSRELSSGSQYMCRGGRPWLGEDESEWHGCSRPLRGSLRGATNVYYALTRSAIYLPRGNDNVPSDLMRLLEDPALKGTLSLFAQLGQEPPPAILKQVQGSLRNFSDEQIIAALCFVKEGDSTPRIQLEEDDPETAFRRAEYAELRMERVEGQLQSHPVPRHQYAADIARHVSGVTLVEKLRETRVLTGFARVYAENQQALEERKAMMWRGEPQAPDRWLPAYRVFGEGIYLELDEARLREWERQAEVMKRVGRLSGQYQRVQAKRNLTTGRPITPRLVLIHTFAHLLMNQLIFDCGYSSASLRERLYVSTNPGAPMAGMLIYTASGDAEGTMGGLVRMGRKENLTPVVRRAVQNAQWCSADPVCMELGKSGGQGPDSCNLAACHNCSLVPETSCEQFNRFLDRWLVVGDITDQSSGFFSDLL